LERKASIAAWSSLIVMTVPAIDHEWRVDHEWRKTRGTARLAAIAAGRAALIKGSGRAVRQT
jgi:hypothetical protein